VSEVLHVRDDDDIGAEVECLLDRAPLGCKDFREHPQTECAQERYESLEVGEIERSVFDVEYHRPVSEVANDFCRRGVRPGQPCRPAVSGGRVKVWCGSRVLRHGYDRSRRIRGVFYRSKWRHKDVRC
jgi:hypothetical protein